MLKHAIACAGLLATLAVPSAAAAEEEVVRISIRGTVPTICRVEFSQGSVAPEEGTVDLGAMSELCNQIGGYRVVMRHPAGLENAAFTMDGVQIPLSSGTETVIVDSNGPVARTSNAALSFGGEEPVELSALSFRAEPKGTTY